jgi:acyl dehydratase
MEHGPLVSNEPAVPESSRRDRGAGARDEIFHAPDGAPEVVGQTFVSDWLVVDQTRIDTFGRVTEDPDPHHVDPEFAARYSPSGATIAFGFLTLSPMTPMVYQIYRYPLDGDPRNGYPASYGFNPIRFVAPVRVNSRIRGHFTVKDVGERKPGQRQVTIDCRVEIEGEERRGNGLR